MNGNKPFPVDSGRSSGELPEADVQIVTSGGLRIPAHRSILASASPVLESIIDRPRKHRRSSAPTIPILGVPGDAVAVFVRFLYSTKESSSTNFRSPFQPEQGVLNVGSATVLPWEDYAGRTSNLLRQKLRCSEEELDKYGIHLLVLSHVFLVPELKQRCSKALVERLTIDNVVDLLQLSRLCDAPDLHIKCMKLVSINFKAVVKTEGWKFVQDNDTWLELQILQFLDEFELRKKRRRRNSHERSLYLQLSEAMECLEHICTEGCTGVGPCDMEPTKTRGPCSKFATCQGLQLLIRHFATCKRRVNGGCCWCKRMWQLFRLHSSICDQSDLCKVPLCREFKLKAQQEKKSGDNERWKQLVRKVVSAKAISSLSLPKRSREEEEEKASPDVKDHHGLIRSFRP